MASAATVGDRAMGGGGPMDTPDGPAPTVAWWRRSFLIPLAITLAFFAFLALPRVHNNPVMLWTYLGVGGGLVAWMALLKAWAFAAGRSFLIDPVRPVKAHYVQATVQLILYSYWGWFWRPIYDEAPLIVSQLVFCFVFDGLVNWSRGRTWRLGWGPVPIVLSVNLFLWFRDDWFYYQFALIAVCVLAKHFILWKKEGRWTHIFNPSAFGLTVASLTLIALEVTRVFPMATEITWARELATSLNDPRFIYIVIFLLGVVVQYFFAVTLMTVSSVVAIALLGAIYHEATGLYQFVNSNLPIAAFFGLHLLLTDPSTSPRTNTGRVIFGMMYGAGYFFLFDWLDRWGADPLFAKLLLVPFMNILVQAIDWFVRNTLLGPVNRAWEGALPRFKMNLVHMAVWSAIFIAMMASGFLSGPHPGGSVDFWKRAVAEAQTDEDRQVAGRRLIQLLGAAGFGEGSAQANNDLGRICIDGTFLDRPNLGRAVEFFDRACSLGNGDGCANLAVQFLFSGQYPKGREAEIANALDQLERNCAPGGNPLYCFLAGAAYENGKGRERDLDRAAQFYAAAGMNDFYAVHGLARIAIMGGEVPNIRLVTTALEQLHARGDGEATWYLAYMYDQGIGVGRNPRKASVLLQQACQRGYTQACTLLQAAGEAGELPAYKDPKHILVPGWQGPDPLEITPTASTAER